MAKGETVGTLRAYFLFVGVLGTALNGFTILRLRPGLGTVFALAGLAIGCTFLFLGIRLKTLLVSSPRLCQQLVIGTGVVEVLIALANLLMGYSVGALQAVFSLLVIWYLVVNLRRLATQGEAPADEPQLTLIAGKAGATVSRAVGWTLIGVAALGALGVFVFLGSFALSMFDLDADAIRYVAGAFIVLLPLALCAIVAYVGLRLVTSTSAAASPATHAPAADALEPQTEHAHAADSVR